MVALDLSVKRGEHKKKSLFLAVIPSMFPSRFRRSSSGICCSRESSSPATSMREISDSITAATSIRMTKRNLEVEMRLSEYVNCEMEEGSYLRLRLDLGFGFERICEREVLNRLELEKRLRIGS